MTHFDTTRNTKMEDIEIGSLYANSHCRYQ